jgi:hypothetical protein
VGYFRRDCPKNEVRQAAVKIGIIRQGTPYLAKIKPDNSLSDLDLYEEARLEDSYEIVLRLKLDNEVLTLSKPRLTD